jgi:hypothetical protein
MLENNTYLETDVLFFGVHGVHTYAIAGLRRIVFLMPFLIQCFPLSVAALIPSFSQAKYLGYRNAKKSLQILISTFTCCLKANLPFLRPDETTLTS